MVISRAATALVADMPVCVLAVLRHPNEDLGTLSKPFTVEPVGIALSASDARFQNLVENYLGALERTGVVDDLRKRWLEGSDWISELP
jgi:hypothetical protein